MTSIILSLKDYIFGLTFDQFFKTDANSVSTQLLLYISQNSSIAWGILFY
jgi:hypothetical protein